MKCSFPTDYLADFHYHNRPEDILKPIAEAGITSVFWTMQGEGDFIYMNPEINGIASIMKKYRISAHGVAAPRIAGPMRDCWSTDELTRKCGVKLVANRMQLAKKLGAALVWLPTPVPFPEDVTPIRRSMDAILEYARKYQVTIVLEACRNEELEYLLNAYPDKSLAWSLQTAVWSMGQKSRALLDKFGSRLLLIRAGDAYGYGLTRKLPFSGCINWTELLGELHKVAPQAELTLDVDVYSHLECSQMEFLTRARDAAKKLDDIWN